MAAQINKLKAKIEASKARRGALREQMIKKIKKLDAEIAKNEARLLALEADGVVNMVRNASEKLSLPLDAFIEKVMEFTKSHENGNPIIRKEGKADAKHQENW